MKATRALGGVILLVSVGACAAGAETDDGMGTGGAGLGTGGVLGGVGGTPGVATGGTLGVGTGGTVGVGTGGVGTGGTVAGTGGTLAGTGGTVAGTGGSVAGTGGSVGFTQVDSTFATNGYGNGGGWAGYLFTVAELGSVSPVCTLSTDPCFTAAGAKVCASGTLTASYDAFAMIGYNVNQASEPPNPVQTWTMSGTGIAVNVTNPFGTAMRIKVEVAGTEYCTALSTTGGAQSVPFSAFKTNCWEGGTPQNVLPAGSAVSAVSVQVPGKLTTTQYGFCIVSVAPY